MARHDIAALKARLPLSGLIERCGVELRKNGHELKGCCPFHGENTPSFTVFTGKDGAERYNCFGCGAKGDQIQFIQDYYNLSEREAIDQFAEIAGGSTPANDNAPDKREKPARTDHWQFIDAPLQQPAPKTLGINRDNRWIDVPVVAAWPYRDAEGRLFGYACRVEPEPGKKDVIPVCWKVNTDTGEARWKQSALPKPRLLYGAEMLSANPKSNILLVEGEKAADAARRLLAGKPLVVMTWPGGCKAVEHADWSLLAGRKIVGWPDCDSQAYADNHQHAGERKPYAEQPGMAAMLRISELVQAHGASMRIVAVPMPGQWPNGHDLADLEAEGWDGERVMEYLKTNLADAETIMHKSAQLANNNEPPEHESPPLHAYDDMPPDTSYHPYSAAEEPFRYLGVDRGVCFYLPKEVPQIVELAASAHSKLNLLLLAPLKYWFDTFPSEKRSGDGVDWGMAANAMIQRSKRAGVFRSEHVRGRGAWWDDGKAAVHVGDSVLKDNEKHDLINIDSRYIYEARPTWHVNTENPLSTQEAVKFDEICNMPSWERPIFGRLLAGWCFLAPICGALNYRPSIWITGKSGTGKSTVQEKIVWKMVENICLYAASNTSEAGLRQGLGIDAIPVVFDEFESESKRNSEQVQDVLKLLTLSATDNGAAIIKGGQNGRAVSYRIRTMFSFSSIGVNIGQHAAQTRVSVLSLVKNNNEAAGLKKYNRMLDMIDEVMTPEYIKRMHARAISLIPIIRHNARVFAEAGAVVLGMRRLGDQIGTLLAGCFAMYSSNHITPELATEWLLKQDWTEERNIIDSGDEPMCVQHIMGKIIRVNTDNSGIQERSVGELVLKCTDTTTDYVVTSQEAEGALRRIGLRVETDGLWIANSHPELKRIMDNTPWASSWSLTLARIDGATKGDNPAKFAGVKSRYVSIPIDKVT